MHSNTQSSTSRLLRGPSGCLVRNRFSTLCVAGAFIAGSTIAAAAQTTPIPQVSSTVTGGTASTTLTGLPTTTSTDATLSLTIVGDLNSPPFEYLDIFLDGVMVAFHLNPNQCGTATQVINVPQAVLAPLIADGQIVVSYQAGTGTNPLGGGCAGDAFRVGGSLTYTGPGGGGGGTGTPASDSLARFLQDRARALVQNQPDVVRFVDGRTAGHFNADVSQNAGEVDLQSGSIGPFWVAAQGSWTDSSLGDQSYVLGSFGGHTYVGSNTIVGGMVQLDFSERSEAGTANTKGKGWLVGPYFASQLGSHPLYMDGRLLYGKTDNEITPFGAPTDDFDGERWLAMLGVEGKVERNNLTIFPGVDVSYVKDSQDAYVDSTATLVPSQSVDQTEVALSLDFETPLPIGYGDMMLTWGASGIWSDTDGSGPSASVVQFDDGWRGRLDLGYRFENGEGLKSEANAFVDGLGDSYESFGVSASVSFNF